MTVTNHMTTRAYGVKLTDTLKVSTHASILSWSTSQGVCAIDFPRLECDLGEMAGLSSATVRLTATLRTTATTPLTNTVVVAARNPEPANGISNTATTTTTVNLNNLLIRKTANPTSLLASESLAYTLTMTNTGPCMEPQAIITDVLPTGFQFQAGTVSQGVLTGPDASNRITATLGVVSATHSATALITGTVRCVPTGRITNTAGVTGTWRETTLVDNHASVATTVTQATDLRLMKTVDPAVVDAGKTLTYVIKVSNAGPCDEPAAVVTDTLPVELEVETLDSSQGAVVVGGGLHLTATLGSLGVGASAWITVTGSITCPNRVERVGRIPRCREFVPGDVTACG
jgi:uncharacterized repeat protein (TIGR01451 family)